VAFAICTGDGEATPVRCPGGAGDGADDVAAGEVAGDGDAAAAGAGLVGAFGGGEPAAGDGDAAAGGGGLETGAPCPTGLVPPAGDGDSSGAGARAPMFARSWPIRIFPRNTGRSKM